MYEIMMPIKSIIIGFCEGRDVDIEMLETLSDTILLLPDIDKSVEIGLLIMFNLIGDNIKNLPKTFTLFNVMLNKYYNDYKVSSLNDYQFSEIFQDIINKDRGE